MREKLMNCIHGMTTGCSQIQKLAVFNTIHTSMTEYIVGCGNNTVMATLDRSQSKRLDYTMAKMMAFIQSRSMVIQFDDSVSQMPITSVLHRLVMMRMNETGVLMQLNNMSSEASMKAKEFYEEMKEKR